MLHEITVTLVIYWLVVLSRDTITTRAQEEKRHGYHLAYNDQHMHFYTTDETKSELVYQNHHHHWLQTVSKAWKYVKGKDDTFNRIRKNVPTRLFLENKSSSGACPSIQDYSPDTTTPFDSTVLQIFDCMSLIPEPDSQLNPNDIFLDDILEQMVRMRLNHNQNGGGWPAFQVSHWTMTSILVYDIYYYFELKDEKARWQDKKLLERHSFPQKGTRWFVDWYLEIYKEHSGPVVLYRFLAILNQHWPAPRKGQQLNMGEFIHFWSAAANHNLCDLGRKSFGWSKNYSKQFTQARAKFPGFKYFCQDCDNLLKQGHFPEDLQEKSKDYGDGMTVGLISSFFVSLLVFGVAFGVYKRKMGRKRRELTIEEVEEFMNGNVNANPMDAHAPIYASPFSKHLEISKERLFIDHYRVLGSGEFGLVFHGILRSQEGNEIGGVEVAVKTVKPNVEVSYFKALLSEIKIMTHVGQHMNIVSLLGTVTGNIKNREVFVALELCGKGDLLRHLRKHSQSFHDLWNTKSTDEVEQQQRKIVLNSRPSNSPVENLNSQVGMSTTDLLQWSRQISKGMAYLSLKKIIHGDLAARNVLLTHDNIAKISDFGLSRQIIKYSIYKKTSKTPLPWKWLALESLCEMNFSLQSDVWSFGVTLWEIFSLGKVPYPGKSWDHNFVNSLVSGKRMEAPEFGNNEIYKIMMDCWKKDPTDRISFVRILYQLDRLRANTVLERQSAMQEPCVYAQL